VKNSFEIRGDTTVIFIKVPGGKVLETLIDTADLELAQSFSCTWIIAKRSNGVHYVHGVYNDEHGKKRVHFLHRFLLNAPGGAVVDHINHDTFDNRRSNLRIVDQQRNMQNRRKARVDSKTGILNVSKIGRRFVAKVQNNGKIIRLGNFSTAEEARKEVEKYRSRFMPYSKEAAEKKHEWYLIKIIK
jgi:hypothetical protein